MFDIFYTILTILVVDKVRYQYNNLTAIRKICSPYPLVYR